MIFDLVCFGSFPIEPPQCEGEEGREGDPSQVREEEVGCYVADRMEDICSSCNGGPECCHFNQSLKIITDYNYCNR